jgi:hypothetical protein
MAQSVNSLTLIDATSDQPVTGFDPIPSGATIDTTLLGNANFNIRANTTAGSGIGSVVFVLSGATTRNQNENVAPYALFGDSSGNFNNGTFNNGLHTLRATPWSGTNGSGTAGTFLEIQFTVTDAGGAVLPAADAGPDRTLVLPVNSATLNGAATGGPGLSLTWSQLSGPSTATLGNPQTTTLSVSDLVVGSYVFRLTVTDQDENTASDDATVTVLPAGSASVAVTGELKKWHRVTLAGSGPATSETATPNPFSDYRVDVTFSHPGSGKSYRVPGFYAADGDAAESSAEAGNLWFTHFAPDETGTWNYSVSFRTGTDVAISNDPNAGDSAGFFDGASGTIEVLATDKAAPDLRARGRLEYVGAHHLRFAETGEWFMKCGTDAPENLLAYDDFDATPNVGNRRKSWTPHAGDYQASAMAPFTWQGGKGSELLGAIDYLASEGLNAISFLTFSLDGDDDNVFPQRISNNIADFESAANDTRWAGNKVHRDRFDVSKLAQWDRILSFAGTRGMFLHFKTQETENDQRMDGGALGRERILYYRELVARFGHHLALNWNIGEENTNSDAQRKAFAQWFAANDPYRHLVVLHTYPGEKNAVYSPLLGAASEYTGLSLQGGQANFSDIFSDTLTWVSNSAAAGRKWVVACDEPGDAQAALRPDSDPGNSHMDGRKNALWGHALAGGAGVEWYFGYNYPHSDLTCQDFRSRDAFWDVCRHFLDFWKTSGAAFQSMSNHNNLVSGSGNNANRCLANPGTEYVVQLHNGGTATLDLTGASGAFQVRWFDPRNGGAMQTGSVASVTGGGVVALGNAPADPAQDWIVHVSPAPGLSRVLFIRGADRSGGFLEASNDTQRSEQLADVFNASTTAGNHGWNTFLLALENAGYVVSQITETAENTSGPSAGVAIDFTTFDLDSWDVLVFGSNNAAYSAASVDAVETWIRKRGGAALFISDANFGGSWRDAPGSDQPFLSRFGLIVNQDQGTYSLLRSSGDFTTPGHPILASVNQFDGEGVSPFVLNQIPTPAGTTLTKLAVAKGSTRNNNGTNPGNTYQGSSRAVTTDDASLVAIEAGHGRVVGHFDRNTFFNLNGAGTHITRFDNSTFAINLIDWLSGKTDPISPWQGYAQTHFALLPGGRGNPSAAFDADADGNGLDNGVEYLLGSIPTQAADGIPQAPRFAGLAFTFLAANPIPADLTVVIQGSGALDGWTDLATHPPGGPWSGPVTVTPEGSKLRVKLDDPGTSRFFRLAVSPEA